MINLREILLRYIRDRLRNPFPRALPGDINIDKLLITNHIIDILGARRSSKTYFLFNIINKLLASGVDIGTE